MTNYRDFYLTSDKAEEMVENGVTCYVVFEEDDADKPKMYDLTKAIFESLDMAREFVGKNDGAEKLYIASYADYVSGNYDYC
jgi:hypothetical protein